MVCLEIALKFDANSKRVSKKVKTRIPARRRRRGLDSVIWEYEPTNLPH